MLACPPSLVPDLLPTSPSPALDSPEKTPQPRESLPGSHHHHRHRHHHHTQSPSRKSCRTTLLPGISVSVSPSVSVLEWAARAEVSGHWGFTRRKCPALIYDNVPTSILVPPALVEEGRTQILLDSCPNFPWISALLRVTCLSLLVFMLVWGL